MLANIYSSWDIFQRFSLGWSKQWLQCRKEIELNYILFWGGLCLSHWSPLDHVRSLVLQRLLYIFYLPLLLLWFTFIPTAAICHQVSHSKITKKILKLDLISDRINHKSISSGFNSELNRYTFHEVVCSSILFFRVICHCNVILFQWLMVA